MVQYLPGAPLRHPPSSATHVSCCIRGGGTRGGSIRWREVRSGYALAKSMERRALVTFPLAPLIIAFVRVPVSIGKPTCWQQAWGETTSPHGWAKPLSISSSMRVFDVGYALLPLFWSMVPDKCWDLLGSQRDAPGSPQGGEALPFGADLKPLLTL